MSTSELQTLLARTGLVAPEQLRHAVSATRGSGWSWLERLLMLGQLQEEEMCRSVAAACRLPRCRGGVFVRVPLDVIALLPAEVAGEHRAVPLGFDADGGLRVAMMDPTDLNAVREIGFFTGHSPMREVARPTEVAEALYRYYGIVTALWPRAAAAAPLDAAAA